MHRIPESELILNNRNAIYHLDLLPEELAETIITVGDPSRVAEVSKYFDETVHRRQHREFITHTGRIGKKKISVVSTGIGPDNIDIVLNELDALVNIDFDKRTIKDTHTSLNIIRLGTSGSLQGDIPPDSHVAGSHGLGLDNLLHYYQYHPSTSEKELLDNLIQHLDIQGGIHPYLVSSDDSLLNHFKDGYFKGITATCPGFYGPQGRILRLGVSFPNLIDKLSDFNGLGLKVANFEMETSAIYGLGILLGHKCLSLNAIIANRITKQFTKQPQLAVSSLIEKSLGIIENL